MYLDERRDPPQEWEPRNLMEACQGNSPYVAPTVDKYLNNVQYMYTVQCTVQYESFRYIFTPSFTTVAPRIANNTWHKNALFLFIRQLILQLFFCMKMLFRYAQIRTGYEVQNQKAAKTVVQCTVSAYKCSCLNLKKYCF